MGAVRTAPPIALPQDGLKPDFTQTHSALPSCFAVGTLDHETSDTVYSNQFQQPEWERCTEKGTKHTIHVESIEQISEADTIFLAQSLWTRRCCTAGLFCGFLVAFGAIGVGSFLLNVKNPPVPGFLANTDALIGLIGFPFAQKPNQLGYIPGHIGCAVSQAGVTIIPLFLNYALAAIFDAMSNIHTVTLKWALWREGRLQSNSIPRLFSAVSTSVPNSWYMNVLSATALAFAYGSISQMTAEIDALFVFDENQQQLNAYEGPTAGIDWNGYAILCAGVCVFIQTSISAMSLFSKSSLIPTWSSSPLMVSRACAAACAQTDDIDSFGNVESPISIGQCRPVPSLGHLSSSIPSDGGLEIGRKNDARLWSLTKRRVLVKPKDRQPSARSAVPHLRYITLIIWILCGISSLLIIITAVVGARTGSTKAGYIASLYGESPFSPPIWSWYGRVSFKYVPRGSLDIHHRRELLGITLQSLLQSFLTLGLHCAEVPTSTVRDEQIWRQASRSTKGADTDPDWVVDNLTNWPFILLFIFKGVLQWLHGQTFLVNNFLSINLLPLISLTACMFLFAFFLEALIRHQPRGSQPATYGNIELLMKLMDENQHKRVFWGEKGEVNGIRRAGTSGNTLPELRRDRVYYATGIAV